MSFVASKFQKKLGKDVTRCVCTGNFMLAQKTLFLENKLWSSVC